MTERIRYAASLERQSRDYAEGVEAQYAITRQRAAKDGFMIPDDPMFRFTENHVRGQSTNRKEWERLVKAVESGDAPFERVYVKARPRTGRWKDPREHVHWEFWFEKHGIPLVYCNQERHIDLRQGMKAEDLGQFVMNILESASSSTEIKELREKVRVGRRQRFIAGFFPGTQPPYACERWLANASKTFIRVIPPGERLYIEGCHVRLRFVADQRIEAIKLIFDLIRRGSGTAVVAGILNARHFPRPTPGVQWTGGTVLAIARHEAYCGDYVWGRLEDADGFRHPDKASEPVPASEALAADWKPIRYTDFIPDPPVTREVFNEVQRILDGTRELWRRRHATSPKYLLSSLLRCQLCGATYHGQEVREYKSGKRYGYYRHTHHTPVAFGGQCPNPTRSLPAPDVERSVLYVLADLLHNRDLEQLVRSDLDRRLGLIRAGSNAVRIEKAEEELATTRTHMRNALQMGHHLGGEAAVANAVIANQLSSRVTELEEAVARLREEEADVLRILEQVNRIPDLAGRIQAVFAEGDIQARNELIADLCPRIEVDATGPRIFMKIRAL
ncbi:MAG TPA: recombinase family protein [Longimicrobium sp.]|jgi:hypothetical protein|uniref:recombinase family protein n=1 Tax=Longimicrobium sp. TaxID=2029185 RepID=UPI002EDB36F1